MRKTIQFLGLTVIFLTIFSCNKEFDELIENQTTSETDAQGYSKTKENLYIVLGEKKEIAYTVKNMQQAVEYINIHKQESEYINRKISPTHYYIKFIPSNEEHLKLLNEIDRSSETIVLSNYPLDYEIIQEGSFLEKSKADDIKFSELYTTVPVDYLFPNIPYKILDEVYEPTETEDDLEIASIILSGNGKDLKIDYNGKPLTKDNLSDFLNNNTNTVIIDNLHRGNITGDFSPVFDRLTSSVDNGNDLKIALRNTYPSSITQINQLFESYGY